MTCLATLSLKLSIGSCQTKKRFKPWESLCDDNHHKPNARIMFVGVTLVMDLRLRRQRPPDAREASAVEMTGMTNATTVIRRDTLLKIVLS
ncbi:hypothetical protein PanWU01x14_344860 [Parasponia andersonii]|uniref:Uncharacterized protein n=1 Tax=Parasponia andersonii TaxID=3476 RepID=A0A2P5ACW6_PARAD|nr:hypothetical protein PanWU01x14_344860 [Parasponia andersonii]